MHTLDQERIFDPEVVDEPWRPTVWESVWRHWVAVAMPVIIGVGIAVSLGLTRAPVYEAETRLTVGPVDLTSPGLPGLVTASHSLATLYSRSIDADGIVEPISKRLNQGPDQIAARVSSAAIPESPIFHIFARGPSEESAVRLANLAAEQLRAYTRELNRARSDAGGLLARYRRAAVAVNRAASRRRAAERSGSQAHLDRADARLRTAQLRLQALDAAYRQATQQGRASAALVQVLVPASSARSDRRSKLQLWGMIGLGGGLLGGIALAAALGARDARRGW